MSPLPRREFLQSLMEAVSETGTTVVLSSHIVADLERVCDHLVILAHARTQLAGPIDEIVTAHRLLTGPRSEAGDVAHHRSAGGGAVRGTAPVRGLREEIPVRAREEGEGGGHDGWK